MDIILNDTVNPNDLRVCIKQLGVFGIHAMYLIKLMRCASTFGYDFISDNFDRRTRLQ